MVANVLQANEVLVTVEGNLSRSQSVLGLPALLARGEVALAALF